MEIVIFWVIFALVVSFIAINKGRSGMGFFILSILLSPLLGLIIVLILGVNEEGLYNNGELKKCPNCKEYVKLGASICKHCGNDLSENHELINGIEQHNFQTGIISYKIPRNIFTWDELSKNILNLYSDMVIQIKNDKELLMLKSNSNNLLNIHIHLKNKDSLNYTLETFGLTIPSFLLKLNPNKNDSKKEDKVTKLIELSKLLEKGLITQEEFEKSKMELL